MNDRDCIRVFGLLSEYLDQELAPAAFEELEAHLRECRDCVQFFRTFQTTVQLCHQLGECLAAVPVDHESLANIRRAYGRMLARRSAAAR